MTNKASGAVDTGPIGGGQRLVSPEPVSASFVARWLHESSLRAALRGLHGLQRLAERAEGMDPDLVDEYRRFLGATADFYLLYLATLAAVAAESVGDHRPPSL